MDHPMPIIYVMAEGGRQRQRVAEDPGELIYEVDEKGQYVVVKSMESTASAYLRFTNRTSRPVDVWWRDFRGAKRHYVRLEAGTFFDINSFISHPWEFTDVVTKESCVINNKTIFRPPNNIGGMLYRTNWNITVQVRCLRKTAMLVLAQHLNGSEAVRALGLPRVLADELESLVTVFHRPRTPPQRD
ncbi:von Hippel-Lindau tumor suppressor homolog [Pararge aegeria]|uniref:Jg9572 protein n=1 Tax=Pararge aegeria aegeria TaxID=348720 RepID=A0A8S4S8C4_9NEOP|nr:von Hippel-Lindau tumor suppressor homolog [Pararge aegeria]CAH2250427.1 jg9572 [Pararge aegeria aegeria]